MDDVARRLAADTGATPAEVEAEFAAAAALAGADDAVDTDEAGPTPAIRRVDTE